MKKSDTKTVWVKTFFLPLLFVCCFISGNRAWAGTATFDYTGNSASWVVPDGVTSVTFEVTGASGGNVQDQWGHLRYYGGLGGKVTGSLSVTAGQTLQCFVGGMGGNGFFNGSTGGFNGGGTGSAGGGGGGASDIRLGGSNLSNRVVVAGGGGGAANDTPMGDPYGTNGNGGGAGNQNGVLGNGSNGNYAGGGGGYYGGTFGSPLYSGYPPSGGGSNYAYAFLTSSVVLTNGATGSASSNSLNGKIILSWVDDPAATQTVNFTYSGSIVQWTVPIDVTSLSFDVTGASGGNASGGPWQVYGGLGANLTGKCSVVGGATIYIAVGGAGSNDSQVSVIGGFNGGGNGVKSYGGAGGGASDIRIGGSNLSNRVIVAGGGGGANSASGYGGSGGGNGPNNGVLGVGSSGNFGGGGGFYGGALNLPYNGSGGSNYYDQALSSNVTVTLGGGGNATISSLNGIVSLTYTPIPLLTWRNTNFSTVANTGDSADSFDFDGDGIQNLAEYALSGDPKIPDASTISPVIGASGNQVQISFNCDAAKTDISYIIQASPDLSAGSWVDIAKSTGGAKTQEISSTVSDTGAGVRTVTVTDSTAIPAGGKRFLRVKIVNPAQ